jgi:Pyruvate/2-oxoglutarate dehydrogenase complex, dihydrolipoamide dehydrogenase (E3) component, and related enzymes
LKETKTKDIVVIGAGPGGYAAAFRAADLGKKVTLVDKNKELGGVCLNRGCIPSKTLLHISKTIIDVQHLSKIGVNFNNPEVNIDQIRKHKDKIVTKLNRGISQMAKARGVEVLCGEASFLSNNELQIDDKNKKTKILFDNCIIASGSRSSLLPTVPENNNNILTSKTALDLSEIPDSLLVVGGGIIGLELGQVYSALGSKVTVAEFLPDLITAADKDIVKPLKTQLESQFENIYLSSKVVKINQKPKHLRVAIEKNGKSFEQAFDKILISVGRTPNRNN